MTLATRPALRRVTSFVRPAAWLALFSATGNLLHAQGSPAPAGPVVELPKFVVTDSRELPPPESWRYAEIPGFEILANASDRATQQLLKDFGLFRQALSLVMPLPTAPAAPTMLILCGRGDKFAAFVPSGKTTVEAQMASVFLGNREQSAIVIDLGTKTLDLVAADTTDDATTGTDSRLFAVDHDKQLYREYVHYLLSHTDARPPAWLEEGMAQIIMAMKFDKNMISFGEVEEPDTVSASAIMNSVTAAVDPDDAAAGEPAEDRDFNVALRHKALVPLQEFFTVTHDSPEALNPLGNNRWAKQAYAFVHLCLYGHSGRYQKPFALFLRRLGREAPSEALFTDCFKMSYRQMLDEIKAYISFTDYKAQQAHVKLADAPPLVLRDATQSEVGRIKGETLVLAGHPEKARAELIAPYVRGERDPRLLASLGIFQHAAGEDDHARKFLEAATAAKVVRPVAYLDFAQLRYADALAKPAGPDGVFSPAQTSSVLSLLLVARTQPPSMPAVYELIADTWSHSGAKPKKEEIGVLIEGVRLFPNRLRLLYQTAVFSTNAGMNDVATPLVDYALKVAPDAKTKGAFEKLKAVLPAGARVGDAGRTRQKVTGRLVARIHRFFAMIRKSFVMSVHSGHEAEYERRHRPIWPELEAVLKAHGVHNYSIFLHPETRQLFAYAEIEDEARWAALAKTEVCQRWWKHMDPLMPGNPDHSPIARDLREVFHME